MDEQVKLMAEVSEEAKLMAEVAAWRTACEDAHAWGDEMRQVMLAAVLGTDRTGRNAAIERILREWAVEQIEACPEAENYLEISLDYTESTPGLTVLVHIQRKEGETPGDRATRLQAERDAAVARAEAAEAESRRLRDAVERAVEHLTISVPGMRLTLAEPSASLARDVLAAALADA